MERPPSPSRLLPGVAIHGALALLSKRLGKHMLSARYDEFEVRSNNAEPDGRQNGHAWTVAYVFQPNPQWRCTLEWLRVVSDSSNRQDYFGEPALATETQIQLAVRYAIGSSVR